MCLTVLIHFHFVQCYRSLARDIFVKAKPLYNFKQRKSMSQSGVCWACNLFLIDGLRTITNNHLKYTLRLAIKCKLQDKIVKPLCTQAFLSFRKNRSSVGKFPVEQIHNIFYIVFAKLKLMHSNNYINSSSRGDGPWKISPLNLQCSGEKTKAANIECSTLGTSHIHGCLVCPQEEYVSHNAPFVG